MLSRLAERGAVVKSPGSGKQALYSASERLFNIYYLMRRRSHPSSRVRALVSFMTDYYDRDELIDTATTLAREACSVRPDSRMDYHAFYDAILARVPTLVRTSILEKDTSGFPYVLHGTSKGHGRKRPGACDTACGRIPKAPTTSLPDCWLTLGDPRKPAIPRRPSNFISRASEIRPRSIAPRMELGILYLSEDRIDDAIGSATRRSDQVAPEESMGICHPRLGARSRRRNRFPPKRPSRSALSVDADYGLAISELAEIKEEKGQRKDAIQLSPERGLRLERPDRQRSCRVRSHPASRRSARGGRR